MDLEITEWVGVGTGLIWLRVDHKWQAHVKMTMILQIPYNAESVLSSSGTISN